jgi:hypothetical protein
MEALMAGRVSPVSAVGSLLKQFREAKRPRRPKREIAAGHLALVRRCACLACDNDNGCEAAHLRINTGAGTGLKPGDRWALPLCSACHRLQHAIGEVTFWRGLDLDPVGVAVALFAKSGDLAAMRELVFAARERRK